MSGQLIEPLAQLDHQEVIKYTYIFIYVRVRVCFQNYVIVKDYLFTFFFFYYHITAHIIYLN